MGRVCRGKKMIEWLVGFGVFMLIFIAYLVFIAE